MFEDSFKLSIGKCTKKDMTFYYLCTFILNFSTSLEELNDGANIYLFYFLPKYRCSDHGSSSALSVLVCCNMMKQRR